MDVCKAEVITEICSIQYNKHLTKNGKAKTGIEWTVLSAVVMHQESDDSYRVVSMGTGTKCLGRNLMSPHGLVVNDSHAETLARRSLLCFLYEEIEKSFNGQSDTLIFVDGKSELKPGITFHFFTTHVPCGDASIIEKCSIDDDSLNDLGDNIGNSLASPTILGTKRHLHLDDPENPTKKFKSDELNVEKESPCISETISYEPLLPGNDTTNNKEVSDVHRTGAKCVITNDPLLPGLDYHLLGVLRTKPGRGDRTLSLSCSDKICRWNVLGIQGALLMHFLKHPIYLDSFVILSKVFCEEAFNRATYNRISEASSLPDNYRPRRPKVVHLKGGGFENVRRCNSDQLPCASSICWFASDKFHAQEVIARGRLLGLTKKTKGSDKCCFVSKASIFKRFLRLKSMYLDLYPTSSLNDSTLRTYLDYKNSSVDYQQAWKHLKENHFVGWPCASRDLYQFQ